MKNSSLVLLTALFLSLLVAMAWIVNPSLIPLALANGEDAQSVSEVDEPKESAQPDYEAELKELEKTCALLTKNDSSGRVFEAVFGKYMGSKSYSANPPSHSGSTWISHKMVILSDKLEKEVYFGSAEREDFRVLMERVGGIIGDEYMHWPDSPDTDFDIGICASVRRENSYSGRPETLVKLGGKND